MISILLHHPKNHWKKHQWVKSTVRKRTKWNTELNIHVEMFSWLIANGDDYWKNKRQQLPSFTQNNAKRRGIQTTKLQPNQPNRCHFTTSCRTSIPNKGEQLTPWNVTQRMTLTVTINFNWLRKLRYDKEDNRVLCNIIKFYNSYRNFRTHFRFCSYCVLDKSAVADVIFILRFQ